MGKLLFEALTMGQPQPVPDTSTLIVTSIKRVLNKEEDNGWAFAFAAAEEIIRSASIPASLSLPDVESDAEELDLTWRNNGKLLRLITYSSGKSPAVYSHIDVENPFTRGNLIETADASVFSQRLAWLAS